MKIVPNYRNDFQFAGSPACAGRSSGRIMWNVYFLKSGRKKWYYVGSTNRLEKRVLEHNAGRVFSTRLYRPLQLVYNIEFSCEKEARRYEQKIKTMRKEKEKIINQIEHNG